MRDYEKEEQIINDVLEIFKNRFQLIGQGKDRSVFLSKTGKFVFKVPTHIGGIIVNDWEGSLSGEIYAKSKLFYIKNIPIVIMELVQELSTKEILTLMELPEYDWIGCIDCQQVGYNRKNSLVAFDYG